MSVARWKVVRQGKLLEQGGVLLDGSVSREGSIDTDPGIYTQPPSPSPLRLVTNKNLHALPFTTNYTHYQPHLSSIPSLWWQGDSYFAKVWHFKFGMLPNCSHLLTDFRTVFVFALGPFLPKFVICFDFNGNFNGKMAKQNLQWNLVGVCYNHLVISAELHFYSSSGISHLPLLVAHVPMARWPFWPYLVIYSHGRPIVASGVSLKRAIKM